ncbi:hypothetical protein GCM10028796_14960 [Ramlibacter monticola]
MSQFEANSGIDRNALRGLLHAARPRAGAGSCAPGGGLAMTRLRNLGLARKFALPGLDGGVPAAGHWTEFRA